MGYHFLINRFMPIERKPNTLAEAAASVLSEAKKLELSAKAKSLLDQIGETAVELYKSHLEDQARQKADDKVYAKQKALKDKFTALIEDELETEAEGEAAYALLRKTLDRKK